MESGGEAAIRKTPLMHDSQGTAGGLMILYQGLQFVHI